MSGKTIAAPIKSTVDTAMRIASRAKSPFFDCSGKRSPQRLILRASMPPSAAEIEQGVKHLRRADPVLSQVIRQAGPYTLKLKRDRFRSLVDAILSQQVSTKAAQAIRARLVERVGSEGVTPKSLACLTT